MIKTVTKGAGDQFKTKKWRFITKLLKCINEKGLSSNHGVKVIHIPGETSDANLR